MIRKITYLSVIALLTAQAAFCQGILNAELNATPLSINPAFTGMFNGNLRANTMYDNQWSGTEVPYVSYGAALDLQIYTDKRGDYLATGFQFHKDEAGDGNLSNFSSSVSLAFHKIFRKKNDSNSLHISDLAIGIQAGYDQATINLATIFFGAHTQYYTNYSAQSLQYQLGLGNDVTYYPLNIGACFSHTAGPHLSYTLGAAAYNLVQPHTAFEQVQNQDMGLTTFYVGEIGADWAVTKRLTLRPEVFLQNGPRIGNNIIAGNEFHYVVSKKRDHNNNATSLFLGGWYRTGNTEMITAGVEFKCLRVSAGYDVGASPVDGSQGGIKLSVRYIAPHHKAAHTRTIPCTRF